MKHSRTQRVATGSLLVALTLVGLSAGVFWSSWGTLLILRTAIRGVDGLENATVEARSVSGSRLSSLEIVDLRVRSGDTLLAAVDTLRVRYRFSALLRRTLVLSDLALAGPSLELRGCASPSPTTPDDEEPPATSGWKVRVERGSLSRGSMLRADCDVDRGEWTLDNLDLDVSDVRTGDQLSGRVDSLRAVFRPAGAPVGYAADLRLSLTLEEGRLSVSTLTLRSPESALTGGGVLRLPADGSEVSDIDFDLRGERLALRDLSPFLPGLSPDGLIRLEAKLTGSSRRLEVSAGVDLLPDGGSLALESTWSAGEDSSDGANVDFRGVLEATGFDLQRVLANGPAGPVDGDLEFDLRGPTVDELTGRFELDARRVDPFSLRAASARLTAVFEQGRGEVEGRFESAGDRAAFAGWVRPLGPSPELSLSGDFGWNGPATSAFTNGALAGSYSVALSGETFSTLSGQGALDLNPSLFNRSRIEEASLKWSLDHGLGEWSLTSVVGAGSLSGEGAIDLTEGLGVHLASLVVRDLEVAALVGDSVGSSVSGSFNSSGQATTGQLLGIDGRIVLGPSSYGSLQADSTGGEVRLKDGQIDADLHTRTLGGSINAALEATLEDGWQVRILEGGLVGVDLGRLRPTAPFTTAITGSFSGEVSSESDSWSGQLSARLGPSLLNRLQVDAVVADATLSEGSLTYLARVSYPSGELRIEGNGRPSDSIPTWHISNARFTDLSLSALLTESEPAMRVSGSLGGTIRGADQGSMAGDVKLALESSTIGDWDLRSASLEGEIKAGVFEGRVLGEIDGASVEADVGVDFTGSAIHFRGEGGLDITDLAQALPSAEIEGAIAGTFTFEGDRAGAEDPRVGATLRLGSGQVRGLPIDSVTVVGEMRAGYAVMDTVALWSPDLIVSGGGGLTVDSTSTEPSDFQMRAQAQGPKALETLLDWPIQGLEEATLDVSVTGPGTGMVVRGEATGAGLATASIGLARFESTAEITLNGNRGISHLEATASSESLRWKNVRVQGVQLTADSEGAEYAVSADAIVDERYQGHASGHLQFDSTGTNVRLTALRLSGQQESWELDREAGIAIDGAFVIRDFGLSSPSGHVGVSGTIDPRGEQSLRVDAERVRFDALAELAGYSGLSGILDSTMEVTGTAAAPIVSAEITGELTLRGARSQQLQASIRYQDRNLNASGSVQSVLGQGVNLEAVLPFLLTLEPSDSVEQRWAILDRTPLSVDLSATDFPAEWFEPFLDDETYRAPKGRLNADVQVRGTRSDPILTGSASLREGGLRLFQFGIELEGAVAEARLDGKRVMVDSAQVRSGGGTLQVTGVIEALTLTDATLDLGITLNEFEALRSEFVHTTVAGELTLKGTTSLPRVEGTLEVLEGDLYLAGRLANDDAEVVELTAEDYVMLEERFGYRPSSRDLRPSRWRDTWGVAVDVRFGRDTWIRQRASPRLLIQFGGDVRVEKEPGEIESIVGTLEAITQRSYIEQFGRRFALTRGTVVFDGPPTAARVDIETEYPVPSKQNPNAPEIVIKMGVEGGMDDLSLILSSDPVVENADIVSYLATGRPANQTLQTSTLVGEGLVERGTNLALDRATGVVEGFASESVGLDVVEIRTDGANGPTLIAGRYVAPRLYLGFKQPVTRRRTEQSTAGRGRAPEIEIEYQTFRWLLLNLQRGGSRIEFFLRSRYAY